MGTLTTRDRLWARVMRWMLPGFAPGDHHVRTSTVDVPMSDGMVLKAALLMPDDVAPGTPTIVIRSPYGRSALFRARLPLPYASRGFPVLLQSCRGTAGSGGDYRVFVDEQQDGIDTLRWVAAQRWYTGATAMVGMSYLGYAQWAVAGRLAADGSDLAPGALSPSVAMADASWAVWHEGVLAQHTVLGNLRMQTLLEKPLGIVALMLPDRALDRSMGAVPLEDAGGVLSDRFGAALQESIHMDDPAHAHWRSRSHTDTVGEVTAPVQLTTGWDDFMLRGTLEAYDLLREAGRSPRLTIGPWAHETPAGEAACIEETIELLEETFLDVPTTRTAPVRFYVMSADDWVESAQWPPDGVTPRVENLHAGGALGPDEPGPSDPTRYVYDAVHPTPASGGPVFHGPLGPYDDTEHETRDDVVTFTSSVLEDDLEIAGTPTATIWLQSDCPSADVFVRLNDVDPSGRSMSVCDGIRRVGAPATRATDPERTADGAWPIEVTLSPIAHRFRAGHRLRVQISSGAHPRYARNHGTGHPQATDTEFRIAHQAIFHEPGRTSRIILPEWKR